MKTEDLDYDLPPDRIAQTPAGRRGDAKLLAVDRNSGATRHLGVTDFPALLQARDLVVLNDTRVFPARIHAVRKTGGKVKILLLDLPEEGPVRAMVKSSGRLKPGETLTTVEKTGAITVTRRSPRGLAEIEPAPGASWDDLLRAAGRPPLPPYIRRPFGDDPQRENDRDRYQTVFARRPGSVAAPTAGLHLTADLLERIGRRGVRTASVTLHVGPGTFRPVRADEVDEHEMEAEWCSVTAETARTVRETRKAGGRVVAVGTTTVRALESAASKGEAAPFEGPTDLFIRPPFAFRAVDALLTNFHLPRSTLLALVGAFAGLARVREAYREAIREGYRFYSYGDACFFH